MNYNQFSNISCYEEFEIQCALTGISKIDVLKIIGHEINDYYFFISVDGIFNWFDLKGNHVEDPGILKELKEKHIPKTITKCVIPDSLTNISDRAFQYCDLLKEITIPNSITNIEYKAFFRCGSLTSITIPNNVTSISYGVFAYCGSLKEITIPDSVTNIGYYAFRKCGLLKEIIFKGKTLDQVKQMKYYPFGIEKESIIKCEL